MTLDDEELRRKRYLGYMFRPMSSARYSAEGQDGLRVEGTVCWTLSSAVGRSERDVRIYVDEWNRRGYMIGLLVRKGQRIEELSYAAETGDPLIMQPSNAGTADLATALSIPPDTEWVTFTSVEGRRRYTLVEPNVVAFEVTLRIRPAARGSQVVPVVSRHRDGRFSDSFMPGLWVLPEAR